jgi:uncharacterized protein (TIGR02271 family)
MTRAVVGLFEDTKEARKAMDDLKKSGFKGNEVNLVTNAKDSAQLLNNLPAVLPEPDVRFYMEGVRQGGSLVVVDTAENRAAEAAAILARYNMIDVDTRMSQYNQQGGRFKLRDYSDDDYVLPVVEEQLSVGKRAVERGRMRIYTRVSERPVEEQVTLREEHVNVERRPVNRTATEADIDTFQEGTFEVSEMAEEAVVAKRARVVEEVVIGKNVEERTETVRDSVRRTDVEVEDIEGQRTTTGASTTSASTTSGYNNFDTDFRNYYQSNYANSGYTYDQYTPVFRYGHDLAVSDRYKGRDWNAIESDARRDWEAQNPGTWEQFKDSVRYAWDKVRGRA